jgi:putative transposase
MNRTKPEPLTLPESINVESSMYLARDWLPDRRTIRLVNTIDHFNCESLGIKDVSLLRSERLIRSLAQIVE